MNKNKELERENASLKGCIDSVLVRLSDYDGCHTSEDLKRLIDNTASTLISGYPERLFDWKGRAICPLCHQKLK